MPTTHFHPKKQMFCPILYASTRCNLQKGGQYILMGKVRQSTKSSVHWVVKKASWNNYTGQQHLGTTIDHTNMPTLTSYPPLDLIVIAITFIVWSVIVLRCLEAPKSNMPAIICPWSSPNKSSICTSNHIPVSLSITCIHLLVHMNKTTMTHSSRIALKIKDK